MAALGSSSDLLISGDGMTHRGCVRPRNEDAILIDPEGELWAVADGMGGHGQGDVAATMVIDALAAGPLDDDPIETLIHKLEHSNAAIFARAAGSTMGSTIVAAFLAHGVASLVWVGDSRIYLWRQGRLQQVSKDHSHVQELIDQGVLTPEAALTHPERNVITRAIGVDPEVVVDFAVLPLAVGDRLLLCSDGLTGCVSDAAIAQLLARDLGDLKTTQVLVDAALEAGAPDNVSVIVITAAGHH